MLIALCVLGLIVLVAIDIVGPTPAGLGVASPNSKSQALGIPKWT